MVKKKYNFAVSTLKHFCLQRVRRGGSDQSASSNVGVLITTVTMKVTVHGVLSVREDGLDPHVSTVGLIIFHCHIQ